MRFAIRFIRRSRRAQRQVSVNIADELAKQGRWIAWVSQETAQGRKGRLYIDPRKWAVLGLALAVLGYVSAAVALHVWLDRRPHNQVALADLMLPWRWPDVPEKRAEGYALRGIEALEAGQVQTGIFYLQRSFGGKPDNDKARLALAKFYHQANYYDGVRRTVLPQLKFGVSRELRDLFLSAVLAADDLATLQKATEELAAKPDLADEERWGLQRWQVRGLLRQERRAEALALLEGPMLRDDREMALLRVEALLATGRTDEAWAVASQLPPNELEAVPLGPVLRARCRGAMGDRAGLEEELRALVEARSGVPLAWIRAARLGVEAGAPDLAMSYVRGYLARWGGQPAAVRQLLDDMMDTGNAEVAVGTVAEARLYQPLNPAHELGLVLVQVRNARWNDVERGLRAVEAAAAGRGEPAPQWTDWARALLNTARAPGRREDLLTAVGGLRLHPAMFQVMLEGFERSGDLATVAALAESGRRQHPHSWQLARWTDRVAVWREEGRIDDHDTEGARRSAVEAAMRGSQGEVPENAVALGAALQELLAAQRWEEAGALVRRVRRARPTPPWLDDAAEALSDAEMRSAAGLKDWLRVRQLAPELLRRDAAHWAPWLLDQAAVVEATGNVPFAYSLVALVLEQDPENERARAWVEEQAQAEAETKADIEMPVAVPADVSP